MSARPVLRHPADRAFVAQVDHGCRAAVSDSDLPCAGTRVGMRELTAANRHRLATAVRAAAWDDSFSDSRLTSLGYVEESSDLPRARGVVRLELDAFCTSAGRLAWAKASGCRWDASTCARAAKTGSLEALQWAREHGCPWDKKTSQGAASGGHLNVLQWARENGCPCSDLDKLLTNAAESGNVEMATRLRELGCPLHGGLCARATGFGHLKMLTWLREHGCPVDLDVCITHAGDVGHDKIRYWLGQFTAETWHTAVN